MLRDAEECLIEKGRFKPLLIPLSRIFTYHLFKIHIMVRVINRVFDTRKIIVNVRIGFKVEILLLRNLKREH